MIRAQKPAAERQISDFGVPCAAGQQAGTRFSDLFKGAI